MWLQQKQSMKDEQADNGQSDTYVALCFDDATKPYMYMYLSVTFEFVYRVLYQLIWLYLHFRQIVILFPIPVVFESTCTFPQGCGRGRSVAILVFNASIPVNLSYIVSEI